MLPALNRFLVCCFLFFASTTAAGLEFSAAEQALILQHGPWPMSLADDSSNRASGNPAAIRLGERLFFDHDLGGDSKFSCASCHDPGQGFADGKILGQGRVTLTRNTPTLLDLKANRWFGWGGENDSLWAQSIRPILETTEMASSLEGVKALIMAREQYRRLYQAAFGNSPENETGVVVLVNTAKALAAYQETLVSERSDFDEFRDAMQNSDQQAMNRYPESAQRGLRIFIGEGRCTAPVSATASSLTSAFLISSTVESMPVVMVVSSRSGPIPITCSANLTMAIQRKMPPAARMYARLTATGVSLKFRDCAASPRLHPTCITVVCRPCATW
jgi:cytochrome c peroxidase